MRRGCEETSAAEGRAPAGNDCRTGNRKPSPVTGGRRVQGSRTARTRERRFRVILCRRAVGFPVPDLHWFTAEKRQLREQPRTAVNPRLFVHLQMRCLTQPFGIRNEIDPVRTGQRSPENAVPTTDSPGR